MTSSAMLAQTAPHEDVGGGAIVIPFLALSEGMWLKSRCPRRDPCKSRGGCVGRGLASARAPIAEAVLGRSRRRWRPWPPRLAPPPLLVTLPGRRCAQPLPARASQRRSSASRRRPDPSIATALRTPRLCDCPQRPRPRPQWQRRGSIRANFGRHRRTLGRHRPPVSVELSFWGADSWPNLVNPRPNSDDVGPNLAELNWFGPESHQSWSIPVHGWPALCQSWPNLGSRFCPESSAVVWRLALSVAHLVRPPTRLPSGRLSARERSRCLDVPLPTHRGGSSGPFCNDGRRKRRSLPVIVFMAVASRKPLRMSVSQLPRAYPDHLQGIQRRAWGGMRTGLAGNASSHIHAGVRHSRIAAGWRAIADSGGDTGIYSRALAA